MKTNCNQNQFTSISNKGVALSFCISLILILFLFLPFQNIFADNGPEKPLKSQPKIRTNAPVYNGSDLVFLVEGGTSASWSGPNNFTSDHIFNVISPADTSASGIYYCSLEDTIHDTTYHLSIYFEVSLPRTLGHISMSTFDTIICEYATLYLEATSGYGPYSWYDPNMNLIATTTLNELKIPCVSLEGYYYVAIGGAIQDSLNISTVNCCADSCEDILLLRNKFLSTALATYSNLAPKIAVQNYLLLDQNYAFPNTNEIVMLPHSMMSSCAPGTANSITMSQIWIHGCDTLWDYIDLSNMLQSITVTLDKNLIEDGREGILSVSFSYFPPFAITTFKCTNNTFNNNYKALDIEGYTLDDNLTFESNTFTSTSPFLLPPYSGEHGYVGLQLYFDIIVLPYVQNTINFFTNLRNGIMGFDATQLKVAKGVLQFEHILPENTNEGYGMYIWSTNPAYLTKQGVYNSGIADFDFNDCLIGIYLKNCDGYIYNNILDTVHVGIKFENCQYKNILIDTNTINCYFTILHPNYTWAKGIELNQNDPLNYSLIRNNTIHVIPHGAVGGCIWQFCSNNPSIYVDLLSGNRLVIDNSGTVTWKFGYFSYCSNGTSIGINNDIYLDDPQPPSVGAYLGQCDDDSIFFNSIYGSGYNVGDTTITSLYPKGIESSFTINSDYKCNNISDIINGITFEGTCTGSTDRIKGNIIEDYWTGLYYNSTAVTGTQDYTGNQWIGTCGSIGARNDNSVNYLLSRYYVNPSPGYLPTNTPAGWFVNGNDPNYECSYSEEQGQEYNNDNISNNTESILDSLIATNSISFLNHNDALNWRLNRYLYDKICEDSSLLNLYPILNDYYNTNHNSSAAQFQRFERSKINALTNNAVVLAAIRIAKDNQYSLVDSIIVVNNLLQSNINSQDSIGLIQVKNLISQDYKLYNRQLDSLYMLLMNYRNTQIANLIIENSSLPDTATYEYNQKAINDIYLNTIAKGLTDFTASQVATIYDIASQCPYSGGNAVYVARSIYQCIQAHLFNDSPLCQIDASIDQTEKNKILEEPNIIFKYHPNPVKDYIMIEWNSNMTESCLLEIFNSLGVKVQEKSFSLTDNTVQIRTNGLGSGVYFLKVKYGTNIKDLGKFVVIK